MPYADISPKFTHVTGRLVISYCTLPEKVYLRSENVKYEYNSEMGFVDCVHVQYVFYSPHIVSRRITRG